MVRPPATIIDRFLRGETRGFVSRCARTALVPSALAFGGLARLREALHSWGVLRSASLPVPVISVGNGVVGGTGKTPFVRYLLRRLTSRGERPLVLGRGYGAQVYGGMDEEGASLVRDFPDVPVVQGRDRLAAVRPWFETSAPPTVVILDDGSQHLRVRRDLDIVLVDATCPFGAGWPLPAGSLREFSSRPLRRSHLCVVTRSDEVTDVQPLMRRLEGLGATRPVLRARHALLHESFDAQRLRAVPVHALSGIANPGSFHRTLRGLGAEITGVSVFPDHHPFSRADLDSVVRRAERESARAIVATGKDQPKIGPSAGPLPVLFLEVEARLDPEGEAILEQRLLTLFEASRVA